MKTLQALQNNRKRDLQDGKNEGPPLKKQPTLQRWGSGKEIVTQHIHDRKIINFVVEEMIPLQIVDKPSFIELVRLGLGKDLSIMCSKTLKERIDRKIEELKECIIKKMAAVDYVATTTDCWSHGKKSYVGVTAHWINPSTLNREHCALAIRHVKGRLTYDALARELHDIHVEFKVQNKVTCTTTDNGTNFVKAFKYFSTGQSADESIVSDENDVEYISLCEIFDENEIETENEIHLPPHRRCASHSLNLVATTDAEHAVMENS